jgi:hypothetical protein
MLWRATQRGSVVQHVPQDRVADRAVGRAVKRGEHRHLGRKGDLSRADGRAAHAVLQPGPLHAFYERTKHRRGHGKAIVATARKLAVLFWCMLTRSEDYAHQQPSLTRKKLRRLEITAGAPKYTRRAAGIWSTNKLMREAEVELARQAETSYKRTVQDQQAGPPAKKAGASVSSPRLATASSWGAGGGRSGLNATDWGAAPVAHGDSGTGVNPILE